MAMHTIFLNQAFAGHRLACTWFLKIVSMQMSVCVNVCVSLPLRQSITSGMMYQDTNLI